MFFLRVRFGHAQVSNETGGVLRIVVIDSTCFDLPDSDENARVFGRPGSRTGTQAAFPKIRLVILVESGTHIII